MKKKMELEKKTIKELKVVAKSLGIRGLKKMNKQLIITSTKESREKGVPPTKKELLDEARSLGIKNATTLKKEDLAKEIEKKKVERPEEHDIVICKHRGNFFTCNTCREQRLCIHGEGKYFCKKCDGTQICRHGKKVFNCFTCSEERRQEKKKKKVRKSRVEGNKYGPNVGCSFWMGNKEADLEDLKNLHSR